MTRSAPRRADDADDARDADSPRIRERETAEARDPRRDEQPRPDERTAKDDKKPKKQPPAKKRSFFGPFLLIAGAAVLLVAIIAGVLWWLDARHYENTDDAFIDTHIVRLASQIAGRIARVDVNDNQLVQPGQLLVEIDTGDARTRVEQAIAQVAQAESQRNQAQTQVRVAQDNYEQQLAAIAGAEAQAQNAARDLARYHELMAINAQAVAQQQVDQAEATARSTAAQLDAARKQAQALATQRAAAEAQVKGAEAQVNALKAQTAQAQINLGYTRIVAPVAGHVAQRSAAIGNYVTPGQQMMAIVPLQIWVTANFKETQLAYMRPGQPVQILVDACPASDIRGHVDSIQRGAGQAFGLLPPENATGNFIKVVQRVPVKIVLDTVPRDCPLGPGMSVEPTVKVR